MVDVDRIFETFKIKTRKMIFKDIIVNAVSNFSEIIFFYLLYLFRFYKNTKIQNSFINIKLHKNLWN